MTVEEYAAACEELGSNLDDVISLTEDSDSTIDALKDAVAEVKSWNPPEELQEFHKVQVRGLNSSLDVLQDTDLLELMRDLEKATEEEDQAKMLEWASKMAAISSEIEDEMLELEDEAERVQEDLSPATREILEAADCL